MFSPVFHLFLVHYCKYCPSPCSSSSVQAYCLVYPWAIVSLLSSPHPLFSVLWTVSCVQLAVSTVISPESIVHSVHCTCFHPDTRRLGLEGSYYNKNRDLEFCIFDCLKRTMGYINGQLNIYQLWSKLVYSVTVASFITYIQNIQSHVIECVCDHSHL